MAAKTFDEFWKILEVPHSRQGDDYVFIKELSEVVWKAATKAAEEKFTSTNTGSPKLPTRADFIEWLSTFESAPSASSVFDWVCRQLRAGA
jgi:hypothetical protein